VANRERGSGAKGSVVRRQGEGEVRTEIGVMCTRSGGAAGEVGVEEKVPGGGGEVEERRGKTGQGRR